jgi:hypothetical protein
MTHRAPGPEPAWHNWRDRSPVHRIAYDTAAVAALAVLLSLLFILGDLVVYGTVRW